MVAITTEGEINSFSQIPKIWNNDINYRANDQQKFYDDGFRQVVNPVFDPYTEKRGNTLYFDEPNDNYTYNVIPLTPEEQAQYLQSELDNDNDSQNTLKFKHDGVILFDRIMADIKRRFNNGEITGNEAKNIVALLYPNIEPLYKGLYSVAKVNLNNATPPANAHELAIFNEVKAKINAYLIDNPQA